MSLFPFNEPAYDSPEPESYSTARRRYKKRKKAEDAEMARHFAEATGEEHPQPELEELSYKNNYGHWLFGGGEPMHASIDEITPPKGHELQFGEDGLAGYDTHGAVGRVLFKKHSDGSISALPDKYDFNKQPWGVRDPEGFPYKEIGTRINYYMNKYLGVGDDYFTNFHGRISPNGNN